MNVKMLDEQISISSQVNLGDLGALAAQNVEAIVCNRPDAESSDQLPFEALRAAAQKLGINAVYIPFRGGEMTDEHCDKFVATINANDRIHAYCRTGKRSADLWAAARLSMGESPQTLASRASRAGIALPKLLGVSAQAAVHKRALGNPFYEVVIIGAGSGGIAVAASLLKRNSDLRIAIVDRSPTHFYQPGWTLVGAGVFTPQSTRRLTQDLIPRNVTWIRQHAAALLPEEEKVLLDDGSEVNYQQLIVSPGLKLDWSAIDGLEETLGKNSVTSNYRFDLAPYTWELVRHFGNGKAIFTQPPMPIKCAGAPQKALYLSADYWHKRHVLDKIDLEFYSPGAVLFGVEAYVPALMEYVEKYHAHLHFSHTLHKVDGEKKTAWFKAKDEAGIERVVETSFDMLHVCPPQSAPDFVREARLGDDDGWLDVDPYTLRHKSYENVWGVGDVINAPNAKTMAAARKQVPVVAQNIADAFQGRGPTVGYDGYGSCPLTVERGKVVLAEFGYGGKQLASFPRWLNDGAKATTFSWLLKAHLLPSVYWQMMLKGREWLASPQELIS